MSSSDRAISVRGLGKSYSIRHNAAAAHTTLAESIMHRLRHPLARAAHQRETFWALSDVNFEVKKGEVVGIIGRNGAGKSTLLKILSRITEPTIGEIDLYGRVGSLLEVGTGFHQELTGRENVYLNGSILGMRKREIDQQFEAIVDFAGVEKFLDTPVKRYSSGMYVRLAFAVAAHLRSEILIVDEVLAVGDAEFQRKCLDKMHVVAQGGRTVLFVSHNMTAVRHLCSTGILLLRGKVAHAGAIGDCIAMYSDDRKADSPIIDRALQIDDVIRLSSISVNGSASGRIFLRTEHRRIHVRIDGAATTSVKMSLELRLQDSVGNAVAFFSPGHERGATVVSPGPFVIEHVVELPRLNRGEYVLALYLSEPSVRYLAQIPDGVRIEVEGAKTLTGHSFDYAAGAGYILLDEDGRH